MESNDVKKLREEIRSHIEEMLISPKKKGDGNDKLITKSDFDTIKKNCYNDIVDLKGEFESAKEIKDKKGTIKKIDTLVTSLKELKTALQDYLD